jgi:hypothetical protein
MDSPQHHLSIAPLAAACWQGLAVSSSLYRLVSVSLSPSRRLISVLGEDGGARGRTSPLASALVVGETR